jgi:hypothetical protein
MAFGPLGRTDPLWSVKAVHPEFSVEDLRQLSEAMRAEGTGVYPATIGTGKEIFESITIWNPQCKDYSFEVRWALGVAKTGMHRPILVGITIRLLAPLHSIHLHNIRQPFSRYLTSTALHSWSRKSYFPSRGAAVECITTTSSYKLVVYQGRPKGLDGMYKIISCAWRTDFIGHQGQPAPRGFMRG